ncbi:hypothetical protein [Cupriavidus necator]
MPLSDLFATLTQYLHTQVFRDLARHAEYPAAFTRQRKLTPPTLSGTRWRKAHQDRYLEKQLATEL